MELESRKSKNIRVVSKDDGGLTDVVRINKSLALEYGYGEATITASGYNSIELFLISDTSTTLK